MSVQNLMILCLSVFLLFACAKAVTDYPEGKSEKYFHTQDMENQQPTYMPEGQGYTDDDICVGALCRCEAYE